MKITRQLAKPLVVFMLSASVFTVGCSSDNNTAETIPSITTTDFAADGATSVVDTVLDDVLVTVPLENISQAEAEGLLFMREEEKLARDVYIAMYALGYSKVFDNISKSEQTHTDAILTLLIRYGISDPVGNNPEGVFEDVYLQGLYDALIAAGSASLLDGLYVGAEIEEIDILDIQHQADLVEDNKDIVIVYENLMKGSRNHLRAFVINLEKQGVTYAPRHLTQEVYDAIINGDLETN
jgi:hypothetical protein